VIMHNLQALQTDRQTSIDGVTVTSDRTFQAETERLQCNMSMFSLKFNYLFYLLKSLHNAEYGRFCLSVARPRTEAFSFRGLRPPPLDQGLSPCTPLSADLRYRIAFLALTM